MSALVAYHPGPEEAAQLERRRRVESYFATRQAPTPRPARPLPLSPFHPLRIEAEQQRIRRQWEAPDAVIYDFGPGYIGVMCGSRRRKHADLTITKQCEEIAEQVAAKHKVSILDIASGRRDRVTSAARQEVFWRCRKETASSIPAIGKLFNRDHTTVLWGIKQHQKKVDAEALRA